ERRAALEQRLEGRWQERLRATEKFQLAVDALEQEKQGLQSQIAQVLEGRQQLAHLKMSLSLEVATYRTLLEAENSRLQTPGVSSKASLNFLDPKLELHFPGTLEGQRLGPVLSPTSLPSLLPNTLQTPVPVFLKSQEFLQTCTPTLASTPIPPTPQAPCPAANAEIQAQDAPCSLLPPQGGKQQAPEPLWAEAQAAVPASILPGPKEPGGEQQEASPGQVHEDQASLAPPLSPDHPSSEAKDQEPSGSAASSIFQEEGKGPIWGLVKKEAAVEVQVVSSLQQQIWQEVGDLDMKESQDSQGLLEKETLKALGEEMQKPLIPLENQNYEALEKDRESLRSLEENLETLKSLEKENQEVLRSLEEKDTEIERPLEKEATELPKPAGKEDSQALQSLENENQELMISLESNLETVLFPEKGNQELVRFLEEENLEESLRTLEKKTKKPLRSQEAEDQEMWKSLPKENQESLRSLEDETQKTFKLLEDNQEPLTSLEENKIVRPLEKEKVELLKPLEEDEKVVRTLEKEDQESLRSLEETDQKNVGAREKENQEPLGSPEEEDEKIVRPVEKENQESLGYLQEDEKIVSPLEKENWEPLGSLKEDQETMRPLEKENQELLRFLDEGQKTLKTLEKETQQSLRALGEEGQMALRHLGKVNPEPLESPGNEQEIVESPEKENQELFESLKGEGIEAVRSSETQNLESLKSVGEDLEMLKSLEAEKSLWSLEEKNRETVKCLEKEIQETLGSMEENQETLSPQEKENQETLRPLGKWSLENLRSPEEAGKEGRKDLEGGSLLNTQNQELLRSQEEEARELCQSENRQVWEDVGDQGLDREAGSRGEAVGDQEPALREQDGNAAAEAWRTGSPDPPERRVPAEGPQDVEGLQKQEAAQGMAEVTGARRGEEEEEEAAPGGHQASPEVTWGSETARGQSAAGGELGLEQEVGGGKLWEEAAQPPPQEHSPQAESSGGLEAALPSRSGDPEEHPKDWGQLGPEALVGAGQVSPADAPQPGPTEPYAPTPIPEDSPGPQPRKEGAREEVGWGLEGRAEALGKVEAEQEEARAAESEVDELGETLPDSTPLGLYLRSPSSPGWDLAAEAEKEGWDPAVPASGGSGAEEEQGPDSELSDEFEDLETEASFLPGAPRKAAEPLGQADPLLESAAWGLDGESDGFADEEESGEEVEEEEEEGREPGARRWRPESPGGSLPVPRNSQRGDPLAPEALGISTPWDDRLQGAAVHTPTTAMDAESQDSADPSGSEEGSDSAAWEKGNPSGVEDTGPGDTHSVNGGPGLEEESEHTGGRVLNGLQQPKGGGSPDADRGTPSQEEEGVALKTPWPGAPLHLAPSQFLKFKPREGDGDSWSSGED
ncbi:Nestin, partial [Fukomys damarensis]